MINRIKIILREKKMTKLKKIITTTICLSMLAGTAQAMRFTQTMTASATTMAQMQSSWSQKIATEKEKYPETYNGKQCYWNGKNIESYTTTPCVHSSLTHTGDMCLFFTPKSNVFDERYRTIDERDNYNLPQTYGQCAGFAEKLFEDIYDKGPRIRRQVKQGYYTTVDGTTETSVKYIPQAGDVIRFGSHSIFITSVNTSTGVVKFAQCNDPKNNTEGTCAIDWDATTYAGTTINVKYLQDHAAYFERATIAGDLNLDGNVNAKDCTIFENTIYAGKDTFNDSILNAYDLNYDGIVNEQDYNIIKNSSNIQVSQLPIVDLHSTVCIWNYLSSEAFCASDGGYYTKNDNGGVSFIGVKDSTVTSFEVPSRVLCSADNSYYNVTEIGYPTEGQPITKPLQNLYSVTAPSTIKKIHSGAFSQCSNLKSFSFKSAPTQLTEIGNFAFTGTDINYFEFYNALNLKSIGKYAFSNTQINQLNLINNTVLETIGDNAFDSIPVSTVTLPSSLTSIGAYAFANCVNLTDVTEIADQYNSCSLWQVGEGAFRGCKALKTVTFPTDYRSLELGANGVGVFDVSASHQVTMTVPNYSTTKYRGISLRGNAAASNNGCICNDVTAFKKGYLIIKGGTVNIYDRTQSSSSILIGTSNTTDVTKITPIQ